MRGTEREVCLLLGSNIRPEQNLPAAVNLLQKQLRLLQASSVWETTAVGSAGPNFLNAALRARALFDVLDLKERVIHPIEAQLGRVRTSDKNAPRTIDIDLILFDGQLLDATLWKYAYRAVPVAEILPGYLSDTGATLKDVASRLANSSQISVRTDVSIAQRGKQRA